MLRTVNISKTYSDRVALNSINLTVPKQTIFGLLGPNGAGKTTFIRLITQILTPDSGEIYFNNENLALKHIKRIGYLPEERGLYKTMNVGDQLLFLGQLKGLSKKETKIRISHWLKKLEITDWWDRKIEDLSKGMQQKVQFIATVIHEPELIILDEPFSGFDPITADLIKDEIISLKEKGSTIIFSTHRMDSVEELCDNIAVFNKSNKILEGSVSEIKKSNKQNAYEVESDIPICNLSSNYTKLSTNVLPNGNVKTDIQINNGTSNHLLEELIVDVQVFALKEKVPSIHEIFVSKIKENAYERNLVNN